MTTTNMPLWVWAITLVVIGGLLAFDFFFHVRKAHEPSLKEAAWWSAFYVGVAVVFGIVFALIARSLFIFLGMAIIDNFT